MDRGSARARSIVVDLAPDKCLDKLYPPRISESAETIMAIEFYLFNSHHQILDNGITFLGYHRILTIYLLTKVLQATYYFFFIKIFHPL